MRVTIKNYGFQYRRFYLASGVLRFSPIHKRAQMKANANPIARKKAASSFLIE